VKDVIKIARKIFDGIEDVMPDTSDADGLQSLPGPRIGESSHGNDLVVESQ
jgi:hypothetical protein